MTSTAISATPTSAAPTTLLDLHARAGDVVLLRPPRKEMSLISRAIAGLSGSPYSHVILALGPDRFVEAIPDPGTVPTCTGTGWRRCSATWTPARPRCSGCVGPPWT